MSDYQKDALNISDDTTAEELIDYTVERVKKPLHIENVRVYDFNTHEPNIKALEKAVEYKLEKNIYKIPLQVTGANTFIISLLPNSIRQADNLIFRKNIGQYYAYKSFHSASSHSQKDKIRDKIKRITNEH